MQVAQVVEERRESGIGAGGLVVVFVDVLDQGVDAGGETL